MDELNDFLNLISDAKKESENKIGNHVIENLSDKIKENPFSSLLETTKIIHEEPEITQIKKPDTSFLFGKIKDNSFLSLLETEIVKSKEVEQVEQIQEKEFASLFDTAKVTLNDEVIAELIVTEIVEEVIPEVLVEAPKPKALTDASHYDKLFKTNVDLFNQPNLPKVNPEIKALTDKIQYMENWLSKISMAGPGGGEVNLRWLDDIDRSSIYDMRYLRYNNANKKFEFAEVNPHDIVYETQLVTNNNYTINDSDYYIGIDYAGSVDITLPSSPSSGRILVIKDESGHCSVNPINVHGTVDNDPQGFILQIDNGAIQLLYRNGWRII